MVVSNPKDSGKKNAKPFRSCQEEEKHFQPLYFYFLLLYVHTNRTFDISEYECNDHCGFPPLERLFWQKIQVSTAYALHAELFL